MNIIRGNLWSYQAKNRPVAVTTNGIVRYNGSLVMGAGVALQAAQRFPDLPARLGCDIKQYGNVVMYYPDIEIISFPTKNHYKDPSSLDLIANSAKQLAFFLLHRPEISVVLPPPGCGLGKLSWKEVEPILDKEFHLVFSRVNVIFL